MKLTLRLDRVTLLEVVLFEPDDPDESVHESCAATEIPFGFTAPDDDDSEVPDEW